jgi:hypothetical protein
LKIGLQIKAETRVRRSREKWSEIAILKILSPVRLPFRHTGCLDFTGFLIFSEASA